MPFWCATGLLFAAPFSCREPSAATVIGRLREPHLLRRDDKSSLQIRVPATDWSHIDWHAPCFLDPCRTTGCDSPGEVRVGPRCCDNGDETSPKSVRSGSVTASRPWMHMLVAVHLLYDPP
jgi:hypothetical protein